MKSNLRYELPDKLRCYNTPRELYNHMGAMRWELLQSNIVCDIEESISDRVETGSEDIEWAVCNFVRHKTFKLP